MMTPELNARIAEMEMTLRRTAPVQSHHRPNHTEESSDAMKHYTKYLRYALTAIAHVGFGMRWN